MATEKSHTIFTNIVNNLSNTIYRKETGNLRAAKSIDSEQVTYRGDGTGG